METGMTKDVNDHFKEGTFDMGAGEDITPSGQGETRHDQLVKDLDKSAPTAGALLSQALDVLLRRSAGEARAIPTPWPSFNDILGSGLWPGLHVLLGTTASGKTQFALQTALGAALRGTPTLYIALELGETDVLARLLALLVHEEARRSIKWSDLYLGKSTTEDLNLAIKHGPKLAGVPLRIEVGPPHGWSPNDLAPRVEAMRAAYPEDKKGSNPILVVVDFLQLVAGRDGDRRLDLRERIGRASYEARHVARTYDAAVLLLSSVSRGSGVSLRDWGRDADTSTPKPAADLVELAKESGDIEYSADSVIALAPGEFHNTYSDVHAVAAKLRAGRPGSCRLRFNGSRFDEPPPAESGATWGAR
jgi:replicative DNA helicase